MSGLGRRLRRIGFVEELASLEGNQRVCIFLQPVWAILYNLYAPYASLYMLELGLSDIAIGALASLGLFLQIFTSLFGGILIDRLGRNKATLIFDLLSWSLPCLLWALAGNFWCFFAAALFAAFAPISSIAITSLLVEDCPPQKLVNVYAFWSATGYIAAFFAPISMLMVNGLGVVTTMRILYFTMFLLITAKFIGFYFLCRETKVGLRRIEETRGVPVTAALKGYREVLGGMLRSPQVRVTLLLSVLLNIAGVVAGNFFAIHITQSLGVDQQAVALFPMVKSILMLIVVFCLQRWLNRFSYRRVMLAGALLYLAGHICILLSRSDFLWPLGVYIAAESVGQALLLPRKDSLITLSIDPSERARVMSLVQILMVAVTMPFGAVGGALSTVNRLLPFVLTAGAYLLGTLTIALSPAMRGAGAADSGVILR